MQAAELSFAKGVTLPVAPSGLHGAVPAGMRYRYWEALLDHAADGDLTVIQALAGVLATALEARGVGVLPLYGIDAQATRRMMTRWFPGADVAIGLSWPDLAGTRRHEGRSDEIEDLVALLLDSGPSDAGSREERHWLAHGLAQATLGENHLWQDLHLPSRRELSTLMRLWFPLLASRNDRDMKWKKFLYKQLCEKAQIDICRAPSCNVCSDYAHCFGPEEGSASRVA